MEIAEITTEPVKQAEREAKFTMMDPCSIVSEGQQVWTTENFTETVILQTSDGVVTLSASRDTAADLSSISKKFLNPVLILNNLRCLVRTYDPEGGEK